LIIKTPPSPAGFFCAISADSKIMCTPELRLLREASEIIYATAAYHAPCHGGKAGTSIELWLLRGKSEVIRATAKNWPPASAESVIGNKLMINANTPTTTKSPRVIRILISNLFFTQHQPPNPGQFYYISVAFNHDIYAIIFPANIPPSAPGASPKMP